MKQTLTRLPHGTKVLHTEDGELGYIMNGFAYDADAGGWVEYEVETHEGIEVWKRDAFVLLAEVVAAAAEADAAEA